MKPPRIFDVKELQRYQFFATVQIECNVRKYFCKAYGRDGFGNGILLFL